MQTGQPYVFTRGDPLNATDPLGLDGTDSPWPLPGAETDDAALAGGDESVDGDISTVPEVRNSAGELYPNVTNPVTGTPIPPPPEGLKALNVEDRESRDRSAYIKEWKARGYATPRGGWDKYQVHRSSPNEWCNRR